MKPIIVILWTVLMVTIACNRRDEQPYYRITDEKIIHSVLVKEGSYFVYIDSASLKEDSLIVTQYQNYQMKPGNDYEPILEIIEYKANGSGSLFNLEITAHSPGKGAYNSHRIHGSLNKYRLDGNLVTLPFNQGGVQIDSTYSAKFKTEYRNYYQTYRVLGKDYADVYEVKTTISKPNINYYQSLHSFYSMDNGLIRFVADSNGFVKVYNLSRSLIKR